MIVQKHLFFRACKVYNIQYDKKTAVLNSYKRLKLCLPGKI